LTSAGGGQRQAALWSAVLLQVGAGGMGYFGAII
jgi:hypothetical protein